MLTNYATGTTNNEAREQGSAAAAAAGAPGSPGAEAAASELKVAAAFVTKLLRPHLPTAALPHPAFWTSLEEAIVEAMAVRFAQHWHPAEPAQGSGYRCIRSEPGKPDPTVLACLAAELGSGRASEEAFGMVRPFQLWVDPGEVSARVGERGHVEVMHSSNGNAAELTAANIAAATAARSPRGYRKAQQHAGGAPAAARRGRSSMPSLSASARSFSPSSSGSDDESAASSSNASPPPSPQMNSSMPSPHPQHPQHMATMFSPMQMPMHHAPFYGFSPYSTPQQVY